MSENFDCWATRLDKGDLEYKHIIQDTTLFIDKGVTRIILDSDDIMKILETLGIATEDFKSGYISRNEIESKRQAEYQKERLECEKQARKKIKKVK